MQKLTSLAAATALVLAATAPAFAQSALVELMTRHGVPIQNRDFERAFDEGMAPSGPLSPGAFATPLALMTGGNAAERINAAYAFGILAGRSGRGTATLAEQAAAGQLLVSMLSSEDRRTRIAAARVTGRVFAPPLDTSTPKPAIPAGAIDTLFTMLNRDADVEQLAAMDALGLLREASAAASLTERYRFYRENKERALAGGAIEALARIGHPSSVPVISELASDPWSGGEDATALAIAFARERLLKDGSVAVIRTAVNERQRGAQARGYLVELGATAP
ncbi:MAG TPA: hypothetical protein VFP85_09850 [Vicinamibacterales bacterium]|nr:hypothetical protein [Vicinamibacterales bacterium]